MGRAKQELPSLTINQIYGFFVILGDRAERDIDRDRERESIFRIRDRRRLDTTFRDEALKSLERDKVEGFTADITKKLANPSASPVHLGEDLQYWTEKVTLVGHNSLSNRSETIVEEKKKMLVTSILSFPTMLLKALFPRFIIPPQMKFVGVYWNQPVSRSGGLLGGRRSVCPQNLVRTTPSNSLDTWQKCSLGAVDVGDTHFVKFPSIITELLPLI